MRDPQLAHGESVLDLRTQEELSLYFQISDFLTQQLDNKVLWCTNLNSVIGARGITKDIIIKRMKAFLEISRSYLDFLRNEDPQS